MFTETRAYSGFAVGDVAQAREFYADILGLRVTEDHGMLTLHLATGGAVVVYPKPGHVPASYTILNFPVDDIDKAVDELVARGVTMERYEGFSQDDRGVMRGHGPDIAWFTDPAGNVLSVIGTR
ncbi:glyoxalase [Longispora fulva]|uniref:Catechol 2,3-dioxygenase-like lactoylglutathione lyase family enzyme n=1 Tax=Longispora fulva TaxID=619741 RepID=A0A8J7KIX1_9ACTN|nr:VOC family protein [Longispora fulva]MBG6134871.1 catechol 2,3-dioxygenase-like lactoylglutathione lyase family enzyme [Longispora fulva]GIG56897.1 glyoxalase [Longispora fulva]